MSAFEQSLPRLPDLKSFNAWSVRKSSFGPLERDACHRRPGYVAWCLPWAAFVRFGSKADICSAKSHVRFTPESGHWIRHFRCLL